jgi:tetratricopeptide (TPR) repeat protein
VYSLSQGFLFLNEHNKKDPYHLGWLNYATLDVANWIKTSLPKNANLMSSWTYGRTHYFLNNGDSPIYILPMEIESRINKTVPVPYLQTPKHPQGVSNLLYWREGAGGEIYPYTTLSEDDLIKDINRFKIDYLLITTGGLGPYTPWDFQTLPSYFKHHAAFTEVYRSDWKETSLYIFKVDRRFLNKNDPYPLIVNANLIFKLIEESSSGEIDIWRLVNTLGNNNILVEPKEKNAAEACIFLGEIYLKHDQKQVAFDLFQHAVLISPDSLPASYVEQAKTMWQERANVDVSAAKALGRLYMADTDIDKAIVAFRQATALDPEDVQAYLHLAEAYMAKAELTHEQTDFKKVIESYRQALILAPRDSDVLDKMVQAYLILGDQYFEREMVDEVVAAAKKLIDFNPDNWQAYWKLANIYRIVGQKNEEASTYAQVVGRWPFLAEAHLRLGQAYEAQGEIEAAVSEYEQAVTLAPTVAKAYIRLGRLYRAQNQLDISIAWYQAATQNNLKAAWPHLELGKLYLEQASAP